jgi:uncharacterized repeat protein (TIGR04138 family)
MHPLDLDIDKLERVAKQDGRYKKEAFLFVCAALQYTLDQLDARRHISARELLNGISQYGRQLYGPMTKSVFEHWGATTTQDFGEILYLMIDGGVGHITTSPTDSLHDFKDVYDFEEEFDWRKERRSH